MTMRGLMGSGHTVSSKLPVFVNSSVLTIYPGVGRKSDIGYSIFTAKHSKTRMIVLLYSFNILLIKE